MDPALLATRLHPYCVLATDESGVWHSIAALEKLRAGGVTPAPLIVADVVAAAVSSTLTPAHQTKRKEALRLRDRLRELHGALGTAAGTYFEARGSIKDKRLRRALLVLETLFAEAPHLGVDTARLIDLEIVALTESTKSLSADEERWIAWRRRFERGLITGPRPRFAAAVVQLRESGGAGFATVDESVWHALGQSTALNIHIAPTSRLATGDDREFFRDLRGPFEELGAYTIPPDPSRLVITDLALMGSQLPTTRALIASKIADASLSVRFGSVERPARRRAQCLLVIALGDNLRHHRHLQGHVVPEVDFLREVLVYTIPYCVRTFAKQTFDTAVEIRRDGALRCDRWRAESIRSKSGAALPELANVESTVDSVASLMPWMLDDSPARHRTVASPRIDGFDARFLLSFGIEPQWRESIAPTTHVALITDGSGDRKLRVRSTVATGTEVDASGMSAAHIATLLARSFGIGPDDDSDKGMGGASWEGTILS